MSDQDQEERNAIMRKRMIDLREASIGPMPENSPWIRPLRMNYVQDGKLKDWDLVQVNDSVALVVFNTSRQKLIFVRQFRPAVYLASFPRKLGKLDVERNPAHLGLTLELCAGMVDKDKPLLDIAKEELLEECGYDAPHSAFQLINTCRLDIGIQGPKNTTFYVEVTDDMRVSSGGGLVSEGELIEVVEMSIPEVRDYITSPEVQSPPGFLFGIFWFLYNKPEYSESSDSAHSK